MFISVLHFVAFFPVSLYIETLFLTSMVTNNNDTIFAKLSSQIPSTTTGNVKNMLIKSCKEFEYFMHVFESNSNSLAVFTSSQCLRVD